MYTCYVGDTRNREKTAGSNFSHIFRKINHTHLLRSVPLNLCIRFCNPLEEDVDNITRQDAMGINLYKDVNYFDLIYR